MNLTTVGHLPRIQRPCGAQSSTEISIHLLVSEPGRTPLGHVALHEDISVEFDDPTTSFGIGEEFGPTSDQQLVFRPPCFHVISIGRQRAKELGSDLALHVALRLRVKAGSLVGVSGYDEPVLVVIGCPAPE